MRTSSAAGASTFGGRRGEAGVRGEESEGVRVWGYGKLAYQKLLGIVLDPDYGDITDPEDGNDLKLLYGKAPGASFPTTDIRPRPRKSSLCDDAVGRQHARAVLRRSHRLGFEPRACERCPTGRNGLHA